MPFRRLAILALAAFSLTVFAQEDGYWRALSTNAKSITGDVAFAPNKLIINFLNYPIAPVRALTTDELLAAFNPDNPAAAVGHLYKLDVSSDHKFGHKNTLCGSDDVQWMATEISGRELHIALFSSTAQPVLTIDAINSGTDLCGVYTYTR